MTPAAGILARHATPADARAIAEIHVETWRDAYAAIVPHKRLLSMSVRSHTAMWAEVLHRRGDPVLVAEDATGQPIGFGTCGPARGTRLEFGGEIYMLYVLPELQGSGAGRELLTGLGRCLILRGMASALVWVLADPLLLRGAWRTFGGGAHRALLGCRCPRACLRLVGPQHRRPRDRLARGSLASPYCKATSMPRPEAGIRRRTDG